jgi:hypothetical protein
MAVWCVMAAARTRYGWVRAEVPPTASCPFSQWALVTCAGATLLGSSAGDYRFRFPLPASCMT